MLRWRYRVPKIERRAALGHMTGYDWENRSLGLRPVKPSPVRGPHRDRNQRAFVVEKALQDSPGGSDNSAAQRFGPMGTQLVSGTHQVILADTLFARFFDLLSTI